MYQTVSCIFHQIFAVFHAKDRCKRGAQARFVFVDEHVWEFKRTPIPGSESLGVGVFMCKTGKSRHP